MAFVTTIRAGIAALHGRLDDVVGVSPGGSRPALRAYVRGEGSPSDGPTPFVAARVLGFKAGGYLDGRQQWNVSLKVRVVFDPTGADTAEEDALYYAGQIDDLMQTWSGMTDGLEGGENPEWSLSLTDNAYGKVGVIESVRSVTVTVARGDNN